MIFLWLLTTALAAETSAHLFQNAILFERMRAWAEVSLVDPWNEFLGCFECLSWWTCLFWSIIWYFVQPYEIPFMVLFLMTFALHLPVLGLHSVRTWLHDQA